MGVNHLSYENIREALSTVGWYVSPIKGYSMYPMLRSQRDHILIYPAEGRLHHYDVAVYSLPNKYIVHRVLEVHSDHYIIRGDNCTNLEYVKDEQIIGVVKGFWRGQRFISCDDAICRFYAKLWVAINPLVRLHHRCRSILASIYRRYILPIAKKNGPIGEI